MKNQSSKGSWMRALMFVVATAILFCFIPRSSERTYSYEVNRPWGYTDLISAFDIPVPRDSMSAAKLSDSITANFVPIYQRLDSPHTRILNAIAAAQLSPMARAQLTAAVSEAYERGVVSADTWGLISGGSLSTVRFIDNSKAESVPTDDFLSQRDAYALIDQGCPDPTAKNYIREAHLATMLIPNVVMDSIESDRLLQEKLRVATAPIGLIKKDECIVRHGERVTPTIYATLQAYETALVNAGDSQRKAQYLRWLGYLVFIMGLLALTYVYLALYRSDLYHNNRSLVCILSLLVVFYIAASLTVKVFSGALYVVPFAIMPIVMCVFFDSRTATFCYTIALLLCSLLSSTPMEYLIIQFFAGITAVYSIKEFSRRSQLIRTAFYAFLAAVVAYCSFELSITSTYETISPRIIGYIGINAVLISFAYLFIFILEKIFGFVSVVTLVELSDINNPTLRELSEECPGTFQHSMAVSNLASDAASRIGANVQLIRTGALYHDIGKLNNPAFFTENQHGVNPHSALEPTQSAKIVINHVRDGLKRADKAKLPQVVRDFISQHHGQGKAKYFYNTYCAAHPDEEVDAEAFTYPGPNPRTVEASILMMADAVEAASRSLKDYSAESIANLVNRIIDAQIADGLHSESPLSFRDITRIKEAFINRLRTMYHARVSYPDDPKK